MDQLPSKEEILALIHEAQDTYHILITYTGQLDSNLSMIMLKWPDAFQAYFEGNAQLFKADIANLICLPLKILVESLVCYVEKVTGNTVDRTDINDTMVLACKDPIAAKKNLIRICNAQIFKLKNSDIKIEYIKE